MKIMDVKDRKIELIEQLLKVWESSVKATHLFLTKDEIDSIKKYVPQALYLEMLFISDKERRKGLGKELLTYGIEKYSINDLAVNEQNPFAKGFYEHMGFKVYKRTECDEQGNPYPLLYMKLD